MTGLNLASPAANAPDTDLCDIDLLHRISIALIGEQDREALYAKIVDAAVTITGSQFGTMQRLCTEGHSHGHEGELQLLYSHGLPDEAVGFWQWVNPNAYSSCTMALKMGERAIIPDFEQWTDIAGTQDLLAFRRAGIRSAQTTPLRSRNGDLAGHDFNPLGPSSSALRARSAFAGHSRPTSR